VSTSSTRRVPRRPARARRAAPPGATPARPDRRRAAPSVSVAAPALRALAVDAPPGLVDAVLAGVGLFDEERFVTVSCAAGDLFVAFTAAGFSAVAPVALYDADPERFALERRRETGRPPQHVTSPPAGLLVALRSGKAARLRYDLAGLSEFERAVLTKTLEIPAGEVRPYGWVAREIGRPRAVRAVGSALGRNPVPVLIPCHRVVRSDGHVGNYGLGVPMKRTLLGAEGVDLVRLERMADAGVRFVASEHTGVFCVPSCVHARRIRAGTELRFRSASAALSAGYRACRHCLPVSARDAS
jgi:methylated-DNA-[protein]-cysteine S-methyltransferase